MKNGSYIIKLDGEKEYIHTEDVLSYFTDHGLRRYENHDNPIIYLYLCGKTKKRTVTLIELKFVEEITIKMTGLKEVLIPNVPHLKKLEVPKTVESVRTPNSHELEELNLNTKKTKEIYCSNRTNITNLNEILENHYDTNILMEDK